MKLIHAGLLVSSKEEAVAFFDDLLGLSRSREYSISADLTNDLFGLPWDLDVLLYDLDDGKLEVFVFPEEDGIEPIDTHGNTHFVEHTQVCRPIMNHISLSVADREDLIARALDCGFRVYEKEREGKPNLVFLYDRDGNAYEIVEG